MLSGAPSMPVRQLPLPLIDKVRTGITVNSLSQAVSELLANSIDAEARNVVIKLSVSALSYTVEDDGHGICPEDLDALGTRYSTSKMRSLSDLQIGVQTLGFRGEAISSLLTSAADVSITTRAKGHYETLEKRSRSGGVDVHTRPSASQLTHSGTIISVKGFLFNQPVRQRQMATQQTESEANTVQAVLRMALPFVNVGVILLRALTGQVLLHLPKGRSLPDTFWNLAPDQPSAQPQLTTAANADGMYRVNAIFGSLATSYPHPQHQYVYVNRRYVLSPPLAAPLNAHFLRAYQIAGYHLKSQQLQGNNVGGSNVGAQGAASSTKTYPAFLISVECPYSDYDVTTEPDKSNIVFKQLSTVQRLLKGLAERAWGPSGSRAPADADDDAGEPRIPRNKHASRAQLGEAAKDTARLEDQGQGGAEVRRKTLSLDALQRASPIHKQAFVQKPGEAQNHDTAISLRAPVQRPPGPLRGLLQLQAAGTMLQMIQSKTMSLAAVMSPTSTSEELHGNLGERAGEDASLRRAAAVFKSLDDGNEDVRSMERHVEEAQLVRNAHWEFIPEANPDDHAHGPVLQERMSAPDKLCNGAAADYSTTYVRSFGPTRFEHDPDGDLPERRTRNHGLRHMSPDPDNFRFFSGQEHKGLWELTPDETKPDMDLTDLFPEPCRLPRGLQGTSPLPEISPGLGYMTEATGEDPQAKTITMLEESPLFGVHKGSVALPDVITRLGSPGDVADGDRRGTWGTPDLAIEPYGTTPDVQVDNLHQADVLSWDRCEFNITPLSPQYGRKALSRGSQGHECTLQRLPHDTGDDTYVGCPTDGSKGGWPYGVDGHGVDASEGLTPTSVSASQDWHDVREDGFAKASMLHRLISPRRSPSSSHVGVLCLPPVAPDLESTPLSPGVWAAKREGSPLWRSLKAQTQPLASAANIASSEPNGVSPELPDTGDLKGLLANLRDSPDVPGLPIGALALRRNARPGLNPPLSQLALPQPAVNGINPAKATCATARDLNATTLQRALTHITSSQAMNETTDPLLSVQPDAIMPGRVSQEVVAPPQQGPIMLGVALSTPNVGGVSQVADNHHDEGPVSPLARFLSFAHVGSDPGPTSPGLTMIPPTQLTQGSVSCSEGARKMPHDENSQAENSQQQKNEKEAFLVTWQPGLRCMDRFALRKVSQAAAATSGQVPKSADDRNQASEIGNRELPATTPSKSPPKTPAAACTQQQLSPSSILDLAGILPRTLPSSPLRLVQSAPPHPKKRSRTVHGNPSISLASLPPPLAASQPGVAGICLGLGSRHLQTGQRTKRTAAIPATQERQQNEDRPTAGGRRPGDIEKEEAGNRAQQPAAADVDAAPAAMVSAPIVSNAGPVAQPVSTEAGTACSTVASKGIARPFSELRAPQQTCSFFRPARATAPAQRRQQRDLTELSSGAAECTQQGVSTQRHSPAHVGGEQGPPVVQQPDKETPDCGGASSGVQTTAAPICPPGEAVVAGGGGGGGAAAAVRIGGIELGNSGVTPDLQSQKTAPGMESRAGCVGRLGVGSWVGILKKRTNPGVDRTLKRVRFQLQEPLEQKHTLPLSRATAPPGRQPVPDRILQEMEMEQASPQQVLSQPILYPEPAGVRSDVDSLEAPRPEHERLQPAPPQAEHAAGSVLQSQQQQQLPPSETESAQSFGAASALPPFPRLSGGTAALASVPRAGLPWIPQDTIHVMDLERDLLRLTAPLEQLVPSDVSRAALVQAEARVMEQVDNKFILAMGSAGTLLILDQHAAHERVRLEHLTAQLQGEVSAAGAAKRRGSVASASGGAASDNTRQAGDAVATSLPGNHGGQQPEPLLSGHFLSVPMQLQLSPHEAAMLERHADTIAAWGWAWRSVVGATDGSRGSGGARGEQLASGIGATGGGAHQQLTVGGNERQMLVCVPSICGALLSNPTDLRVYLHQLHETDGAELLPPAVLRVLRSKACRSAVMFGDPLTEPQRRELITQLRGTQLWTQCAHGRPTVAPLVHLPTLLAVLARRRTVLASQKGGAACGAKRLRTDTLRGMLKKAKSKLSA